MWGRAYKSMFSVSLHSEWLISTAKRIHFNLLYEHWRIALTKSDKIMTDLRMKTDFCKTTLVKWRDRCRKIHLAEVRVFVKARNDKLVVSYTTLGSMTALQDAAVFFDKECVPNIDRILRQFWLAFTTDNTLWWWLQLISLWRIPLWYHPAFTAQHSSGDFWFDKESQLYNILDQLGTGGQSLGVSVPRVRSYRTQVSQTR